MGYGVDCTPGNGICPNLARMRAGKENDDIRDSDERSSGCGIPPDKEAEMRDQEKALTSRREIKTSVECITCMCV